MKINVLLTCVGGSFSPGTILAIKSLDFIEPKIVGVDCSDDPVGKYFCDAFYQVPAGDDAKYVARIQDIVKKENIDFIIPTSDEEALALSEVRDQLGPKTKLACTDFKTLQILSNKIATYNHLKQNNIPVPDFFAIQSAEELESVLKKSLNKWDEFVIKPAVSRGARDVVFVTPKKVVSENNRIFSFTKTELNINEIKDIYVDKYPLLVMQRFHGTVCDLDLLGREGQAIMVVPRKRIVGSRPDSGHIIFKDDSLTKLGEKLISTLKLTWLYDCDFMVNEKGEPCILEINPRQSGSISITHAAGLPVIENLLRMAVGLPTKDFKITTDLKVLPYTNFKEI